ncbi:Glutamate-1-semialdehyde 2,1-aminomutase [compost metagenome]
MVCPFFTDTPVINYESAKSSDLDLFRRYFAAMVEHGVNIAPSQFEGMFVSAVHTEEDIDATIEAQRQALKKL